MTNMQVKDLELKTSSDLRTKNDDYVKYAGTAGGFVAVNDMHLKNTLNQTSEIDIKNSILEATKDLDNVGILNTSVLLPKYVIVLLILSSECELPAPTISIIVSVVGNVQNTLVAEIAA